VSHLGLLGVRVALVDEGVQLLHGLPDTHAGAGLVAEVITDLEAEGDGLESVLGGVEVSDRTSASSN
jgi:hypothetical protein